MHVQIKQLRVKIDGLSQLVKSLELPMTPVFSEELKSCSKSLLLAKAWLGKLLGELGEPTPYTKDGNRHSVADIEPTADKANMNLQSSEMPLEVPAMMDWSEKSHIEKVDWLRQEIQTVVTEVEKMASSTAVSREFAIARTNTYTHLCEARFWLGFELGRIREEQN